jgi:hypothetical protein
MAGGQEPVSIWNVGSNPDNASMNAASYRVIIVPNPWDERRINDYPSVHVRLSLGHITGAWPSSAKTSPN